MTNLGLTGVFHHRVKTHGPWQVKQPFSGIWLWRSPHGEYYLVDETGTRRIGEPARRPATTTTTTATATAMAEDFNLQVWTHRRHLQVADDGFLHATST
jgi:hypothetical protein